MVILENIDIDKAILQNIDIDKISNRFKFGISNRARRRPTRKRLGEFTEFRLDLKLLLTQRAQVQRRAATQEVTIARAKDGGAGSKLHPAGRGGFLQHYFQE